MTAGTVVIGAGLSGLAAALRLGRDGRPVLLLEAGDAIGGSCSTQSIDGYRLNNGAIYVAVPSLLRLAFQRLDLQLEQALTLQAIAHPIQARLQDGAAVWLSSATDSFVEGGPDPAGRTAQLRRGLAALQQQWHPLYRQLIGQVLVQEPSLPRTLAALWRYLPLLSGKADRLIARHFPDPGLQAAVASTLLFTGQAPAQLPSTQIVGLLGLLEEGFHLPQGGMGAISDALRNALPANVELRCGAGVRRIEVNGKRVQALLLESGERLPVEAVVSTLSGFDTLERLHPASAAPAALRRIRHKAPLSHRAIAVQLGCTGVDAHGAFMVNHVPAMDEQGRMHRFTPHAPPVGLSYTVPTRVQPGLAPAGKSIIELYAPVSGAGEERPWTEADTAVAVEQQLAALRRQLPALHIETCRVIDPIAFARDRHLYKGALYGIAPGTPPQHHFPHRSGIAGLALAGQTTFPGFGVPSALLSGIMAAEALEASVPG